MSSAFEKRYGRPIAGSKVKTTIPDEKNNVLINLILLPLKLILPIFRIFVIGPRPQSFIKWGANINPETLLSGFAMTLTSLFTFLYLSDIGKFLEKSDFFGEFTWVAKGVIVVYLIIQFIRGLSFLGGINVIPLHGTIGSQVKFHDGIYRGNNFGSEMPGAFKSNSKSNMDDFMGYMDSKMSLMSNPQKEKYIKDIFKGK
jgi:hypothetical protein